MQVIVAPYSKIAPGVRAVREEVFIVEQQVSHKDEFDGRDEICIQVLILEDNKPLATGRLDPQNGGKIGRVAVLKEHRRRGIGRRIMQRLEAEAKQLGLECIWFHAQSQAVPFYKNLGYETEGEIFQEAGIDHVKMSRKVTVDQPPSTTSPPTGS